MMVARLSQMMPMKLWSSLKPQVKMTPAISRTTRTVKIKRILTSPTLPRDIWLSNQ